jgi:hypothetical protein
VCRQLDHPQRSDCRSQHVNDDALSNMPAIYDVALTPYPTLAYDTRYWIDLFGHNNRRVVLHYDDSIGSRASFSRQ